MKKILLGFIISFSAVNIYSQQLYVSEITVRQGVDGVCSASTGGDKSSVSDPIGARIEFDQPRTGYPAGCLSLCANITAVIQTTSSANLGVDDLIFEIFKFKAGANPLDPSSTPPIRTISMHNVSTFTMTVASQQTYGPVCTAWDGSYNIEGFWGKSNGQFGLRVKVRTNMVSPEAGNINIEQTSAFPGQNQTPITVDVTNIHVIKSTPTVVGKITGVGAQPYNILYRLSKDATVTIEVEDTNGDLVRTIADSAPRFGEGIPDGTLTNGDFWDGRDNSGQLVQPGNYYVRINAGARDPSGWDTAKEYGFNLSLDPLQITDIAIKDLGPLATDVAIISYQLTEDATVYLDIYPPGTTFNNINCSNRSTSTACSPSNPTPLKTILSSMPRRQTVSMYWDGKGDNGNYLCDGNYVFALSAVTKGSGGDLWTSRLGVGTVSIAKGDPLAFLTPSTTVIGSTPPAAGLNPFYFRYQLQRPATVKLEIKDMNNNIIRTLVDNEPRSSGLTNQESWDGKNSTGTWVSTGTYRAALTITDPYVCMSGNTFTHDATFSSNLFRIVDVVPTSIIGLSTQAAISYQLSQSMWTEIKIYKQNIDINPSNWPPSISQSNILYSISGMRPGRYKVTEYWDGRDSNGYMVEDGRYPFTIVAHSTGTQTVYATDKAYGYIDVSRGAIMFTEFNVVPTIADMKNSSDVVKLPPYEIDYSLTRQSSVTVTVNDFYTNLVVARIVSGETRDPFVSYKDFWDGKCYKGDYGICNDGEWMIGTYNVNIYAQDILANPDANITVSTVTMTIDNYPLRIYDLAVAPLTPDSPAIINYQLSEPMKVAIKIYKPGTMFIADEPICSPSEDACLVDTIIGIRPARTSITESWYGTAKGTGSPVPSGKYIFKIFASTNTSEIDSITGNCPDSGCNSLAYDIMIQDLPVVKTYIEDTCKYFEDYSYFAPNPFNTPSGNFKLSLPMIGNVEVRVYNIAGDLVYSYKSSDNPEWGSGISISSEGGCITGLADSPDRNVCEEDPLLNWKKTNKAGRALAPGLYIAVFKFQSTQGSKELCQFKKKILIP